MKRALRRKRRKKTSVSVISAVPMKVIFITGVLLVKWPVYAYA